MTTITRIVHENNMDINPQAEQMLENITKRFQKNLTKKIVEVAELPTLTGTKPTRYEDAAELVIIHDTKQIIRATHQQARGGLQ